MFERPRYRGRVASVATDEGAPESIQEPQPKAMAAFRGEGRMTLWVLTLIIDYIGYWFYYLNAITRPGFSDHGS